MQVCERCVRVARQQPRAGVGEDALDDAVAQLARRDGEARGANDSSPQAAAVVWHLAAEAHAQHRRAGRLRQRHAVRRKLVELS
jgi:hypothetical protein